MNYRDHAARARLTALLHTLALAAAVLAGALVFPMIVQATPASGAAAPGFALEERDGGNQRLSEFRGQAVDVAVPAEIRARKSRELEP